MNIFALDTCPKTAAQYHCDKHVVKMILEYAQLLSTAHRVLDGEEVMSLSKTNRKVSRWILPDPLLNERLYFATHVNHPSAIWARESKQNYEWLYALMVHLMDEYTHRYGKVHKVESDLKTLLATLPQNIKSKGLTEIPQAMPNHCKIMGNTVSAYRSYYNIEKKGFAKWKNRSRPRWFTPTTLVILDT
jgi:hypothetical protein